MLGPGKGHCQVNKPSLCVPARAGAAIGAAAGLVTWALVTWVPAWHHGLPDPVAAALPFALGWAGHVITAYLTRHPQDAGPAIIPPSPGPVPAPVTRISRPDGTPPVSPIPGRVTGADPPPDAA